jgi:hypothetical protein
MKSLKLQSRETNQTEEASAEQRPARAGLKYRETQAGRLNGNRCSKWLIEAPQIRRLTGGSLRAGPFGQDLPSKATAAERDESMDIIAANDGFQ